MRWLRYVLALVLARILAMLGCYVVRDAHLHEAVKVLVTIQRMRHRHAYGRKAEVRTKEDDYIEYVITTLRRGVLPRKFRWRSRRGLKGQGG